MAKEIDQVDIKDEDLKEEDFSPEEIDNDTTDWKAKALELKGIAKRRATQLAKAKQKFGEYEEKIKTIPEKPEPQDKRNEKKSDEFDEMQLQFLAFKSIESDEDVQWTRDELKKAGGTLIDLLKNEYFQAKLKGRQEAKAALDATPNNNRGGSGAPNDSVEYHYQKYVTSGELPESDEMKLKVITMKRQKETQAPFDNTKPPGAALTF